MSPVCVPRSSEYDTNGVKKIYSIGIKALLTVFTSYAAHGCCFKRHFFPEVVVFGTHYTITFIAVVASATTSVFFNVRFGIKLVFQTHYGITLVVVL